MGDRRDLSGLVARHLTPENAGWLVIAVACAGLLAAAFAH